jgi:cytidylate kinase
VIVAIDGPAGAGKSSVARGVAKALGFGFLDTGAMYRAVALAAVESEAGGGGDPGPHALLRRAVDLAPVLALELDGERVRLDGRDVTDAIRAPEISEAASRIAAEPRVREALVRRQQALIARGDWVAEGRDVGTVVAPAAELKVFLTASQAERARRRSTQQAGADAQGVLAEQARRDARDSGRAASPLTAADDAVLIDTTEIDRREVIARIVALARKRAGHTG